MSDVYVSICRYAGGECHRDIQHARRHMCRRICFGAPGLFGASAVKPMETMLFRDLNFESFLTLFYENWNPRNINRGPAEHIKKQRNSAHAAGEGGDAKTFIFH